MLNANNLNSSLILKFEAISRDAALKFVRTTFGLNPDESSKFISDKEVNIFLDYSDADMDFFAYEKKYILSLLKSKNTVFSIEKSHYKSEFESILMKRG